MSSPKKLVFDRTQVKSKYFLTVQLNLSCKNRLKSKTFTSFLECLPSRLQGKYTKNKEIHANTLSCWEKTVIQRLRFFCRGSCISSSRANNKIRDLTGHRDPCLKTYVCAYLVVKCSRLRGRKRHFVTHHNFFQFFYRHRSYFTAPQAS